MNIYIYIYIYIYTHDPKKTPDRGVASRLSLVILTVGSLGVQGAGREVAYVWGESMCREKGSGQRGVPEAFVGKFGHIAVT